MSKEISKKISYLLRHNPSAASLTMDSNGWVNVAELIKNTSIELETLKDVVANNNKKRFEFNEDGSMIRARQGHSVEVDLQLIPQVPPGFLFHGTAKNNFYDIWLNGLRKMKRHHVHLSPDEETALKVGQRHGSPIVLGIGANRMYHDGFKFFKTENNVWLVDDVPPNYISVIGAPERGWL